uniref:Ribonuclease A-domain domain-containing protein n=1 Tax=Electrophorus electricus TaxID=8005 RepID=A0AAY5F487_ELEEL
CESTACMMDEFIKKHIRPDMLSQLNCTKTMEEINDRGKCKKSNTFILDEISNVRKVCRNGTHSNCCYNCYESNEAPKCIYRNTYVPETKIIVACEYNKPVHYESPPTHKKPIVVCK